MTSAQLRAQIAQYVHQVDEEYLAVLKVIIEDRLRTNDARNNFFTQEEIDELEHREKEFSAGKMSSDTLESVNKRVLAHIRGKK